jgi:hypothetical protein
MLGLEDSARLDTSRVPRVSDGAMTVTRTLNRPVAVGLLIVVCAGTTGDPAGQIAARDYQSATFELTPGVVVDGTEARAYLMRPHGGIEAISLDDGRPLWSTDAADKPLWVQNGRLLAQIDPANRLGVLPLVVLDITTSDHDAQRLEAPLPARVSAAIQQGLQTTFTTGVRPHFGDALITWSFVRRRIGGDAPPQGGGPVLERWEGAFEANLKTATVVEADPGKVHAVELEWLPRGLREKVESGELSPPPLRAGPSLARVAEEHAPNGGHRLVLERWRPADGNPLARIVLLDGRPVAHLLSADGRHVLVCTVAGGTAWDRYLWTIHSLETGNTVGSSRFFTSVTPFFLRGNLLIHLSQPHGRRLGDEWIDRPLELRAVAMSEGTERWSRPMRDTRFLGPAPPTH